MAVEKRERTQAIRRESAEALRDGTTLKGVLGAILGGVVGAIPKKSVKKMMEKIRAVIS